MMARVMELVSTAARMTNAIGAGLAGLLAPGDVVVLTGDLGTGKTVLAQGIAAGLGITEPVVSPTFTLVREYRGRVLLRHLDVYRLDRVQEAIDLGLDELMDGAVTVIEWGEGVRSLLPLDRLEITLELLAPDEANDNTRRLTIVACGPAWLDRVHDLTAAVDAALDRCGTPTC